MPITAFIGVRISWLIVARNALLASLAVSAWALAISACSRACCVSLNSRAFWIAITAWSAKVLMQRDLLVAEGLLGSRATPKAPMPWPFQIIGTHSSELLPDPLRLLAHLGRHVRTVLHVGKVQHDALVGAVAVHRLAQRRREGAMQPLDDLRVHRITRELRRRVDVQVNQTVFTDQADVDVVRAQDALRAAQDALEHRRGVGDRVADHFEHFGASRSAARAPPSSR